MTPLERASEGLRTCILGSSTWDYCVIWKLGDDPSRFIELADCFCNGGGRQKMAIGRVKRKQIMTIPFCRDAFDVHSANTKACEALARLPPSLPLYSGLRGEVVISNQPMWLKIAKTSDSSTSNEDIVETQVLIPVLGGLIELFSAKDVPEDQRIIELVKAQLAMGSETETMSTSTVSFEGHSMSQSLNQAKLLPLNQIHIVHQNSHPNFDGSSTSSLPSDEHTSPDSKPCSVSQTIPLNACKPGQKDMTTKENCKSKNLFTERRRRSRINEGLLTLRALVPNITKMNRAATLGDAIDYIEALKNHIEELTYELNGIGKDDSNRKAPEPKVSKLSGPSLGFQVVKADELGSGEFLLRMKCKQIPGAFTKLLEALILSGLHINDVKFANITTCNGTMWTNLTMQTNKNDIQLKDLIASLTSMASSNSEYPPF